ncbi:lysozyme inhibitor LprI family protein [Leptothoe sp. ISB3NOV94-8A]
MDKSSYKLLSKLVSIALLLALVSCGRAEQTTAPTNGADDTSTATNQEASSAAESTEGEAAEPVPVTPPVASSNEAAAPPPAASPVALAKQDCGQLATQQEMNQCAAENYAVSDKALNDVYQEVKQGLNEASKDLLTRAEERWLVFRDAECTFESDRFAGGSIAPLIQASCMEQITDNRIAELRQTITAETDFAAADAELNEVYQAVQALADGDAGEALTDVQLSWLDYRDAHCEYEANLPSAGDVKACLAAITETRVWQLEALQEEWSL